MLQSALRESSKTIRDPASSSSGHCQQGCMAKAELYEHSNSVSSQMLVQFYGYFELQIGTHLSSINGVSMSKSLKKTGLLSDLDS